MLQGQFNGSASGLRLSCLKRLKDVGSVEPNHTVLHQVVEESDEQMFRVLAEIPKLDQAARSVINHNNTWNLFSISCHSKRLQLNYTHRNCIERHV